MSTTLPVASSDPMLHRQAQLQRSLECRKMLDDGRRRYWKYISIIQHYLKSDYLRVSLQLAVGDVASNGFPCSSVPSLGTKK